MDVNTQKIIEIADKAKVLEQAYMAAWSTFGLALNREYQDKFQQEVASFNDAFAPLIAELAAATNNSADTLRMVYRPQDEFQVWFNPGVGDSVSKWLRQVAKHGSFNENYWAQQERAEKPL